MLSEEKAKRKEKSTGKWPLSAFLLPLFACAVICGVSWLWFNRHSSDVPLLDGLSSGEQAEAVILARLPLGSSREAVESFIAEELQPSEDCGIEVTENSICRHVVGRSGLCGYMVWYFDFHFENQLLSELNVGYGPGCR